LKHIKMKKFHDDDEKEKGCVQSSSL
jgi:hypothetical protein